VADGGLGSKPPPVIDPIDQVSKYNQAIGINIGELMKEQRQAKEDAEKARSEAEKAVADMKYEMITRAIADSRAESAAIVKEVRELLQNKPKSQYLFGAADEATNGQFTKEHLTRLFGQPEKPIDPEDAAISVIERAERLKKALGIGQQSAQERVPLEENIEYHRLVLENNRLTKQEEQKLAVEERRIKALEGFTDKIGGLISDFVSAKMAERGNGTSGKPATQRRPTPPAEQQEQGETKLEWGAISCPNPDCKSHKFNPPATIAWPTNAPKGFKGQCVYCNVVFGDDGQEWGRESSG